MVFRGIAKVFDLTDEKQFDTIGQFWDEMASRYGLESLRGLGYNWNENCLSYAIGLKHGDIEGYNISIVLPDTDWKTVKGQTACLKELYEEIYRGGMLQFEIETFFENGTCEISYYRDVIEL